MSHARLQAGDWVEVRSASEILETLDAAATEDSLPFMPEMLRHCGRRYRVSKRAHKTCDTIGNAGGRQLRDSVHLEDLRCDGSDHGRCQARCLLFWKERWLKPVSAMPRTPQTEPRARKQLLAHTRRTADGEAAYVCQATELGRATAPLSPWSLSQYLQDVTSGNERPSALLRALAGWLWNLLPWRVRGGPPVPWVQPRLEGKTPRETLDLRPGELVRIKSQRAIEETLNQSRRNRGLYFDIEMVAYCGTTHRVAERVERIIDEKTGKMLQLPNDCIRLEGVTCRSRHSLGRRFCPRAIPHYWREIWLERVHETGRCTGYGASGDP